MSRLLQLGWSLRRGVIGALRLRTCGVKVMLFNSQGELLLIRNGYGNTNLFVLPGGGVGWREEPAAAAARELAEEVGISGAGLHLFGTYQSGAEGKRDTISLFHGCSDPPLRVDGREVSEAAFFSPSNLPESTSPATRRRVTEWLAGRLAAPGRFRRRLDRPPDRPSARSGGHNSRIRRSPFRRCGGKRAGGRALG